MASKANLSNDDFQRLQEMLLELKTKNYTLEDTAQKQRSALGDASAKVKVLEQELTKAQRTIEKSKKMTEVQKIMRENDTLQRKMLSQEEDFRLQNQTLLEELASLVATNEKYEEQIKGQKNDVTNLVSKDSEMMETKKELVQIQKSMEFLKQEKSGLEKTVKELQEKLINVDTEDKQKPEVEKEADDFSENAEQTVCLKEEEISMKKDIQLKEEKIRILEEKLGSLEDNDILLEGERSEKKLLSEHNERLKDRVQDLQGQVETIQEKLKKKQVSFIQLQNEKESLIGEQKASVESLVEKHREEVNSLSEQNQRLQTQVNNAQAALAEQKEKSSSEISMLKQQVFSIEAKLLEAPIEKLQDLEASKICLTSEVEELRIKNKTENESRIKAEQNVTNATNELRLNKTELEQCQEKLDSVIVELENLKKTSEKRKSLLDEMAVTLQQKSDEHSRAFQESVAKYERDMAELKETIKENEVKIKELLPWHGKFEDISAQISSVEEARKLLEKELLDRDETIASEELKHNETIQDLKSEYCKEKEGIIEEYSNKIKDIETQLELCNVQKCEFEENVKKQKQDIKDAIEDRKISEKKGHALVKDLKRQLQSEKKRNEKLQEKMKECLNETSSNMSDPSKEMEVDRSSISSWSLMSGNNERETSTPAPSGCSPLPTSGLTDQSPEEDVAQGSVQQRENETLLARLAALQEEKWILEEQVSMLETSSSAMADDLVRKSALIQHYCLQSGGSGRRGSGSGRRSSGTATTPDNKMRSMIDKLVNTESHATEAHSKEVHRMQTMLEETLTKNMHLQQDLDHLSQEVVRLSKVAVASSS